MFEFFFYISLQRTSSFFFTHKYYQYRYNLLPASYKQTLILPFWPLKNSSTVIINVKRIKPIGEYLHKWLLEAKLLMGYLAFNLETRCPILSPQNKGKQNCGTDLQPY